MLGEREAMIVEVRGLDVHGVSYVDVTVGYRDGATTTARLGRESVPDDLRTGEVVLVSSAMSVIVAIRRGDGTTDDVGGAGEEPAPPA